MKKNQNIKKFNFIYLIFVFYIIEIIFGFATYYIQKNRYFKDIHSQIKNNLLTLGSIVNFHYKYIQQNNEIAINSFNYYINANKSKFNFSKEIEKIDAINFQTGLEEKIEIKKWYYEDANIFNNYQLFNSLAISLKSILIIAQRNSNGYVLIYSSNKEIDNYQFPLTERFIFTIENGEYAREILKLYGKKFYISAVPLYIGARIEGFLMSISEINVSDALSDFINSQFYTSKGYPIIMEPDGYLLIHPTLQNTRINNLNIYKKIIETENLTVPQLIEYKWPENEKGENKQMLVKYYPEIQQYICITFYLEEFYTYLIRLRIIITIALLLGGLFMTLIVMHIYNIYKKNTQILNSYFSSLASGELTIDDKILDAIPYSAKQLHNKLLELKDFTNLLAQGNYNIDYQKWGQKDEIGESFVRLNNRLQKLHKEEQQKQEEQQKINWLNEGISKFIEVLKFQAIEIEELAYKIISYLVEYINANQGAFYIIVDEDSDKYLQLYAAYSLHRIRLIDRKIPLGVGLVGRVVAEKKILHITEIPHNYIPISTSLGEGLPKSIVIVPLLFNDEIIGVIEINSLQTINELHIQFIEKISENISANLAMWQANQKTANLLKQSEEQAYKMLEQQQNLEKNLAELEKLKELSEQKETEFASIIKAIDTTAILIEFDIRGNITNVNNKFLEIFKKRKEEVIGSNHKTITSFDPKSTEYIFFWKDLTEGKTKRLIESFSVGEETIWLSENFIPITDKDEKVIKILNIAIDITENKLLEKQLREQVKEISKEARNVRKEERKIKEEKEEFLQKEFSYKANIDLIDRILPRFEISLEGNITFCNQLYSDLLQIEVKILLGKNINDYITKEDREKFYTVRELVRKGEPYSGMINFLDAKSEIIKANYYIAPVFNAQNTVTKFIIIISNTKK